MLAEGKHPAGSFENTEIAAVRNRCRIGQVSLYGGALAEFGVSRVLMFTGYLLNSDPRVKSLQQTAYEISHFAMGFLA